MALAIGGWHAVDFQASGNPAPQEKKKAGHKKGNSAKKVTAQAEDLSGLSLEVMAMQVLRNFEPTAEQLRAMAVMAKETAAPTGARRPALANDRLQQTLSRLREALIEERHDAIDDLSEKLGKLMESEKTDLDDEITITPAARQLAPKALALFGPRQVAGYVASHGENFPDPQSELVDAMLQAPQMAAADWNEFRPAVAARAGWLVAGLGEDEAGKVARRVEAVLQQARKTGGPHTDPDRQARETLGENEPMRVLRHVALHDLAELLSNPRLPAAVQAFLRAPQQTDRAPGIRALPELRPGGVSQPRK